MARVPLDRTVRNLEGPVVPGTRLFVYIRGTTTEVTGWSLEEGGASLPQPLVADDEGRFPDVWFEAGKYDLFSPDDLFNATQPWEATSAEGPELTQHSETHEPGGLDPLPVDAGPETGSLRTLGTGATQAAAGDHSHPVEELEQTGATLGQVPVWDGAKWTPDDQTGEGGGAPSVHAGTHEPGGADEMAVDAAAGTGSLRTLGTGATQAAAGDDARLSDARDPTAHTHPLSALEQSGATSGQVATWSGSAWAPSTPGAGGDVTGWINVKDFGATGNGATDDTTAIQNAINSAAPGEVVYFPPGVYVKGTIQLVTPHVTLLGNGPGTTLKAAAGSSHGIEASGNSISIRGFKLDQTGMGGGHGIRINDGSNQLIQGVRIDNANTYAIAIGQDDSIVRELHIDQVRIYNTGSDGIDEKNTTGENSWEDSRNVMTNVFIDNAGPGTISPGIDIRSRWLLYNIGIRRVGNTCMGIRFRDAAPGGPNGGTLMSVLTNFHISALNSGTMTDGDGIIVAGGGSTRDIVIANGTIDCRARGMRGVRTVGHETHVSNVVVRHTGREGFYVNNGAVGASFHGCKVEGNHKGFQIDSNAHRTLVSDCITRACTTSITNNGPNTIISNLRNYI